LIAVSIIDYSNRYYR